MLTPGKRIDRLEDSTFEPGEFGKHSDGNWHGCTPNGHACNLSAHNVVEHEDGTITAAPSVSVRGASCQDNGITVREPNSWVELWHGYLERGVWREV